MYDPAVLQRIRQMYELLAPTMDERARRQWAAAEAVALGWGGVTIVALATGMSHNTINRGRRELAQGTGGQPRGGRTRRRGGGRKRILDSDPAILDALDGLIEPFAPNHHDASLRWTCKSTRQLADELTAMGHIVGEHTVATLLRHAGYRLQPNRKLNKGCCPPDRYSQFEHINRTVLEFLRRKQPVVFVEAKKTRPVGCPPSNGSAQEPTEEVETIWVASDSEVACSPGTLQATCGTAVEQGMESTDIDQATTQWAAEAIHRWWQKTKGPQAVTVRELLITTEPGRMPCEPGHLWKPSLQTLADRSDLSLTVCHLPLGTSRWTKISHRWQHQITQYQKKKPLASYRVVINLIAPGTRDGLSPPRTEVETPTPPARAPAGQSPPGFADDAWNYRVPPGNEET